MDLTKTNLIRSILSNNFETAFIGKICKSDMDNILKCTDGKSLDDPSTLLSCLLESRTLVTKLECQEFIYDLSILVFSDYRLIEILHGECTRDIEVVKIDD